VRVESMATRQITAVPVREESMCLWDYSVSCRTPAPLKGERKIDAYVHIPDLPVVATNSRPFGERRQAKADQVGIYFPRRF
jgi:hypothetical protein